MTFGFGVLFACVTLLAIGLQRTYNRFPAKELKRRARSGDPIASVLYSAVSYGMSLQILLWVIVIMSAAIASVLFGRALEPWFGIMVVAVLLWIGFLWLPASELTAISLRIATVLTPVITWLLGWLHPILERIGLFVRRHRHMQLRTSLYEKEDLVDLLERQQQIPENRISAADIDMLVHVLQFGDLKVQDAYIPIRLVTLVNANDAIGPALMDDLYKSGFSRFPVYEDEQKHIVGTLYLRDLVKKQKKGFVHDVMREDVYYVHEDFTLQQVLQAFIKTKHHLFIVVNSFEEFTGIITIEDILEQIIGTQIIDEFDQYEDVRMVAGMAAQKDHERRVQADKEPVHSEVEDKMVE